MFTTSLAWHCQHLIIREYEANAMQTWTEKLKMLSLSSTRAWRERAASLALGKPYIPSSAYMKVRQLKDLFYDLAIMRVRAEAVTASR